MKKTIFLFILALFILSGCSSPKQQLLVQAAVQAQETVATSGSFKKDSVMFIGNNLTLYANKEILDLQTADMPLVTGAVHKGYAFFLNGDFSAALTEFEVAVEQGGGHVIDIYNLMGLSALRLKDNKTASAYFGKAAAIGSQKGDKKWFFLKLINKGILAFNQKKTDKAIELFQKVVNEATDPLHAQIKSVAYTNLGVVYFEQWKLDDALSATLNSQDIVQKIDDKDIELINNIIMGEVYFNREEYNNVANREPFANSVRYFTMALQYAGKYGYRQQEAEVMNLFGYLSIEGGVIEDAERMFEGARKISENIKYPIGMVDSLCGIGILSLVDSQEDEALYYHTKAREIAKELGYKRGELRNLIGLAEAYFFKGEYDNAIKSYTEAIEVNKNISNIKMTGKLFSKMGFIYYVKEDFKNALIYYNKAITVNSKINYIKGRVENLTYLGLIHRKMGDDVLAAEFSRKAYDRGRGLLTFRKYNAISKNNLGNIYYDSGKLLDAQAFFNDSLKLSSVVGAKRITADNLIKLGLIAQSGGADEKSLKYFIDSLDLSQKAGLQKYIADNYINIGNYYRITNKNDEAIDFYKKAFSFSTDINYLLGQANGLALMGLIKFQEGKYDLAMKHLTKSRRIYENISAKDDIKFVDGIINRIQDIRN